MINNLKLHHIGVATRSIEREFKTFQKLFANSDVKDAITQM